jgi:hypothetical protein
MTSVYDFTHGYSAYTRGCRCDVCRAAKADYMRERRAKARKEAQLHTRSSTGEHGHRHTAFAPGSYRHEASIPNHGTRYGYEEAGCRCAECTAARSASDRKYRT